MDGRDRKPPASTGAGKGGLRRAATGVGGHGAGALGERAAQHPGAGPGSGRERQAGRPGSTAAMPGGPDRRSTIQVPSAAKASLANGDLHDVLGS